MIKKNNPELFSSNSPPEKSSGLFFGTAPAGGGMTARKVLSPAALTQRVRRWRRAGKRVVFTNGCFDLLHAGHVQALEEAKALGDVLIVALNTDRSVRRLKGPGRPLVPQAHRARVIAGLACVDAVTCFDTPTPLPLIKRILPHVLAKGGDWSTKTIVGGDAVRAHGGKVMRLHYLRGCSTTNLINRIRQRSQSPQ